MTDAERLSKKPNVPLEAIIGDAAAFARETQIPAQQLYRADDGSLVEVRVSHDHYTFSLRPVNLEGEASAEPVVYGNGKPIPPQPKAPEVVPPKPRWWANRKLF